MFALAGLGLLAACEEPRSQAVGCGFGEIHLQARAEGARFDGLDLVPVGGGAALVWSDRSGTRLVRLDPNGRPLGPTRRLTAQCPGGVAAVARGDGVRVACARPADRDRGREGTITLLDEGGRTLSQVGPVGAESVGVDVATEGERLVVGWRDADVFTARARVAELGPNGLAERALSSEGMLGSAPSLLFLGGVLTTAWTESWVDPAGKPAGHLAVQREQDPPTHSLDVGDIDVRVRLSADEEGPMVMLRDRRPRGADHRAFAGRLDRLSRLALADVHSPGRADGEGDVPMLVPCDGHLFSVATRRSSRGVTMVSIHRLDSELRSVENEQEIYEYHARFPQAVAACVDDRLLIAVGERQTQVAPVPRLRTYALRCGPGVPHERTPGHGEAEAR